MAKKIITPKRPEISLYPQMDRVLQERAINMYDQKELIRFSDSLIDHLDDEALCELMGGNINDIDSLFIDILEETMNVMTLKSPVIQSNFQHLEKLTANIEDKMRIDSFPYFIQSVLPKFLMNWHHLEWANFIHLYQYLCLIASRSLGKSYFMSWALPLWKMWRYSKPGKLERQPYDIKLCESGILFTYELSLAKELLVKIKEEIEENDILREKLFNSKGDDWSKESIKCKNGAKLQVKSFGSAARGRHPGYVIVDDFLVENVLYSKDFNDRIISYFHSVIANLPLKGGGLYVVGCVNPNSIVLTKNGLVKIGNLNPSNSLEEQKLIPYEVDVMGKEDFKKTSHYWVNGKCATKKITLDRGIQLECSLIHPLWKMSEDGFPDWEKSQDLKVGDYVGLRIGQGFGDADTVDLRPLKEQLLQIKGNPIFLPDFLDEDLAYIVGMWVAEGSIMSDNRVSIVNTEKEIQDQILNNKYSIPFKLWGTTNDYRMFCQNLHFLKFLEYLGVDKDNCKAHQKSIPSKILSCGPRILKPFLQGLYDGDGGAYFYDNQKTTVTIGSTSEVLLRDLQTILFHFGIISNLIQRKTLGISDRAKGKHFIWILDIKGNNVRKFRENIGFRLKRKQDRLQEEFISDKVDFLRIPHQSRLIKQARLEKGYVYKGYKVKSNVYSSQLLTEEISLDNLKAFYEWNKESGAEGPFMDQIKSNIDDNIIYLKIKSIEDSENYTVDFHIPEDHSFLTNGIVSHNTPFVGTDLYADLKKKKTFKVFEYPAVMPSGEVVWEDFYPMAKILEKRATQGSLVFSREILCTPISTDSTIFPYHTLEKCFSPSFTLINNIQSAPTKFEKVALGCDFAISSSVGADYSVFISLGLDERGDIWILNIWREKGKTYNEQIAQVKYLHSNFNYDIIFMEDNQMQAIFVQGGQEAGLPVKPYRTTASKHSLTKGWPSLAVIFENRKIRIPRGNQESIDKTDIIVSEATSITYSNNGGLKSTGAHDDTMSSLFIAKEALYDKVETELKLYSL